MVAVFASVNGDLVFFTAVVGGVLALCAIVVVLNGLNGGGGSGRAARIDQAMRTGDGVLAADHVVDPASLTQYCSDGGHDRCSGVVAAGAGGGQRTCTCTCHASVASKFCGELHRHDLCPGAVVVANVGTANCACRCHARRRAEPADGTTAARGPRPDGADLLAAGPAMPEPDPAVGGRAAGLTDSAPRSRQLGGLFIAVVALLAAFALILWPSDETPSSPSSPGNAYPEEVRNNFLGACAIQDGATPEGCRCILDELEETYSLAEFITLEQKMRAGEPLAPEVVSTMLVDCL